MIAHTLKKLNSDVGGHIDDDHSILHKAQLDETHPGTGCGALDKSDEIATYIKENRPMIVQYIKAIL